MAARRGSNGGLDIKLTPGASATSSSWRSACSVCTADGTWVRHGGTALACSACATRACFGRRISAPGGAYRFLRYLEHRYKWRRTARRTPAGDADALEHSPPGCRATARDRDYRGRPACNAGRALAAVREIYERVVYAQKPMYYTPPTGNLPPGRRTRVSPTIPSRALLRQPGEPAGSARAALAALVASSGLHRGLERFEHFLEKAQRVRRPGAPQRRRQAAARAIDIFGTARFADDLLRYPSCWTKSASRSVGRRSAGRWHRTARFYRRQMLASRASACSKPSPSSHAVEDFRAGDSVIARGLRDRLRKRRRPRTFYTPHDQMMGGLSAAWGCAIRSGFGRRPGFVIPDGDSPEHVSGPEWPRA